MGLPSILEALKPQYFWDVDFSGLNDNSAKRLIIERTFNFGTVHEIKQVISHYGKDEVINVARHLNYIDSKTLNFISWIFKLPKKEFKCFTRMQSKPMFWNS